MRNIGWGVVVMIVVALVVACVYVGYKIGVALV